MSSISTEFEVDLPEGKIIFVDASGDIFEEGDRLYLEEVTFDAWLFESPDDLQGTKLTDEQIRNFKFEHWRDLEEIVDHKLYSRWEQLRDEGPEWERDAG